MATFAPWSFLQVEDGTTLYYTLTGAALVAGLVLAAWAVASDHRAIKVLAGILCLGALGYAGWGVYRIAQQEPSPVTIERWDEMYMNGIKVGYIRTKVSPHEEDRSLRQVVQESRQLMDRFGQPFEMELETNSVETADGELLSFETTGRLGTQPVNVSGRVADGKLHVTRAGRMQTVPWSQEIGGLIAVEQSLERRPMWPGEEREIKHLGPPLLPQGVILMTVHLKAADYESTRLRNGEAQLLRIDAKVSPSGQPGLSQILWMDPQGRVVKMSVPNARQEVFKSTKFEATKEPQGPRYDIGLAMSVSVDPPSKDLHKSRHARYRIVIQGRKPGDMVPSGPTQQVATSKDGNSAEIRVRAIRPNTPGVTEVDRATPDDLKPNRLIESDDERVVAMAKQVAAREVDAWKIAVALERHVRQSMKDTNFSTPLATAAEVARRLEGDCTEHAILLAGLCRARGIPSRVAIGLVYDGRSFVFHMWTEVYIADRWIPLDATRPQGGIGVGHLKLTHSNLQGADGGLASFWRVAEVMNQIKLEILEVE